MKSYEKFNISIIKRMIKMYDVGDVISFSPLKSGTVQTNFLIVTTTGKYVLRYYENRTTKQVHFEKNLIDVLIKNRFPTAPIIAHRGEGIPTYQGKPYLLFKFIEGSHIINMNPSQKANIIKLIARLGKLTKSMKLDYSSERFSYNKKDLLIHLEKIVRDLDNSNSNKKFKWWLKEMNRLDLPSHLPMGICHTDYHYTNILFDNNDITALIDFDDANYTYLYFDIVSYINFFDPSFTHLTWENFSREENILDFSEAQSVLNIYKNEVQIPPADEYYFFDLLKLNLLIDCIWYFERGLPSDFYEKRKIDVVNAIGRERFYNRLFLNEDIM